jgi:hypothetical protein
MELDDGESEEEHHPSELPVVRYRAEILDAVRNNPVVVIEADTGAGKRYNELCLFFSSPKTGHFSLFILFAALPCCSEYALLIPVVHKFHNISMKTHRVNEL